MVLWLIAAATIALVTAGWFIDRPKRLALKSVGITRAQFHKQPRFWREVINEQRVLAAWDEERNYAGGRTIPERFRSKWFNTPPDGYPHLAEITLEGETEPGAAVKEMVAWAHENCYPHQWRWLNSYDRPVPNVAIVYRLNLRFHFRQAEHAVHFKLRWA